VALGLKGKPSAHPGDLEQTLDLRRPRDQQELTAMLIT
jgi:hypothetical protein